MNNTHTKIRFTLLLSLAFLLSSHQLLAATNDNDNLIAQINEATDQRDAKAEIFQRALASSDFPLQKAALIGLGRIGDPASTNQVGSYIYSPQPELRKTAAFALAISSDPHAYDWLAKRLAKETNSAVLAEVISGIGLLPKQASDNDRVALVLPYLDHQSMSVRKAACDAMTYSWSMYRDSISVPNSTQVYKLMSMSQEHPELADHCLYALSRIRTETALFDKQHLQKTINAVSTPYHHKLLLLIIGEQKDDRFLEYIIDQLNSTNKGIVTEAALALAKQPFAKEYLKHYQAILNHAQNHVKISFIQGLAAVPPTEQSYAWLEILSQDKSDWVKYRALSMLFQAQPKKYSQAWLDLFDLKLPGQTTWETMILQIVTEMENESAKAILERAKKSASQAVRELAKHRLNGTEDDETRPNSETIKYQQTADVFSKRLVVKTNRGDIELQLLPVAPYTSYNFYRLATSGYYDGVVFHRVVPNFVVQGGDPAATGSGGPGYVIREELSMGSHLRGTVGMATSGKDTGGSQFYFNLKNNWHLDRRYSIFARVVSGLDVIDSIERGDHIISIQVK